MTSADKTLNTFRLTKEQYDQLIMNSITSTCKNPNNNIKKQITMAEESLISKGQGSNKTNGNKRRGNKGPQRKFR